MQIFHFSRIKFFYARCCAPCFWRFRVFRFLIVWNGVLDPPTKLGPFFELFVPAPQNTENSRKKWKSGHFEFPLSGKTEFLINFSYFRPKKSRFLSFRKTTARSQTPISTRKKPLIFHFCKNPVFTCCFNFLILIKSLASLVILFFGPPKF